jgi:hypothetical protein
MKPINATPLFAILALTIVGCTFESAPVAERAGTAETASDPSQADGNYDTDLADEPPPYTPEGGDVFPGTADAAPAVEIVQRKPVDLSTLSQGEPVAGGELNKFFPKQEAPYDLVFKQEKQGFVLASVQQNGDEVAQLSITDLRSNASAADKFKQGTDHIEGYPLATSGSKGTVLLVGNRYQVQVRSITEAVDEASRKTWLQKFDLAGLEQLDK